MNIETTKREDEQEIVLMPICEIILSLTRRSVAKIKIQHKMRIRINNGRSWFVEKVIEAPIGDKKQSESPSYPAIQICLNQENGMNE